MRIRAPSPITTAICVAVVALATQLQGQVRLQSNAPVVFYTMDGHGHGWPMLRETGKLRFEKVTGNGLHCEARLKYNREKQLYEPATVHSCGGASGATATVAIRKPP